MSLESRPEIVRRLKRLPLDQATKEVQRLLAGEADPLELDWRAHLITELREAKAWPNREQP